MSDRTKPNSRWRAPIMAVLVVASGAVAGCSSVPDEVNPVEWYRGVSGWFESDEDQAQRGQAQTAAETAPPLPGANRDYPNLSTVPERPKSVTSSADRSRVSNGLVADRENARYAYTEPSRLAAPTPQSNSEPEPAPAAPEPVQSAQASRTVVEQLEPSPPPPPAPAAVAPPAPAPQAAAPPPAAKPTPVPAPPVAELAPVPQPQVTREAELPMTPVPPPAAAPQATRPVATSGRGSLLDQTYQAALAQQKAGTSVAPVYDAPPPNLAPQPSSLAPLPPIAAPMPPAAAQTAPAVTRGDSSKTVAGTPIPRSFVVHFRGGAADVAAADRALLREVVQIYKSTNAPLRIVGHASHGTRERDGFGQQVTNLRISLQRAEAVASELVKLGVPREAMTVTGVSDNEPLYDESTQAGIAGNRRAEIFFGP